MEAGDANVRSVLRGLLSSSNQKSYISQANKHLICLMMLSTSCGIVYVGVLVTHITDVILTNSIAGIVFIIWISFSTAMYLISVIDAILRLRAGFNEFLNYSVFIRVLICGVIAVSILTSPSGIVLITNDDVYFKIAGRLYISLIIIYLTYICFLAFAIIYRRTKRLLEGIFIL